MSNTLNRWRLAGLALKGATPVAFLYSLYRNIMQNIEWAQHPLALSGGDTAPLYYTPIANSVSDLCYAAMVWTIAGIFGAKARGDSFGEALTAKLDHVGAWLILASLPDFVGFSQSGPRLFLPDSPVIAQVLIGMSLFVAARQGARLKIEREHFI